MGSRLIQMGFHLGSEYLIHASTVRYAIIETDKKTQDVDQKKYTTIRQH